MMVKKFLTFLGLGLCLVHAFGVQASSQPDAEKDGIQAVKNWAKKKVVEGEKQFKASGYKRQGSPDFWGQQIIYQIQVDRFNNGDLSNDGQNLEDHQKRELQSSDLWNILSYRHGGDLKGILQRLDYIADLGVTTLWLTPVFKHNGSYHGYCTTDFTQVDPGFGTNEELRQLVGEAHKRGLKVVLDVVVNHMCDPKTTYSRPPRHHQCANDLSGKNWSGASGGSSNQGELAFSEDFFGPLKSQHFFNRCGANSTEDMQGTGPAAVYGDFVATMFDFDTRNHDFQEIFTELHKYWISYADVDGFRMDAAKHITEDFVAYFNTQIRAYANSIGKHNFFIIGEVAGPSDWIGRRLGKMFSNPDNPNDHGHVPSTLTQRLWDLKDIYLKTPVNKYPGLNAAYDFAHSGTARAVLAGERPPSAVEDYFGSQYFNDLAAQNDYRLSWVLLEIHDWPRFAAKHKTSMAKSLLGLSYLAFAQGSPVVYYGQEQGFNGDCHFDKIQAGKAGPHIQEECKGGYSHELFRQDMFLGGMSRLGSTVKEINDLAYIGKSQGQHQGGWKSDPFLHRGHELYRSARRFLHIRKSCAALSYGRTQFRWLEAKNQDGVLAFSRTDEFGKEALVVLNTSWFAQGLPEVSVNDGSNG
ncbi:MAG: hypothetical protein KDD43_08375, partial [Bdellovibrionales bacterium]|nr:hypothetical protein [Bdellovibrionales bacterium]